MTTAYIGYGYGRATRRERAAIARADRIIARYWHSRLTHSECDGRPYCHAYGYDHDLHPGYEVHPRRRYYTGHLATPCSRYGSDGDECAWWAVALAFIVADANGAEAFTREGLEGDMGLVVNDSDGPAELVWSYWYAVPPYVRRHIGTRADVAALVYDLAALRAEYA